MKKSKIRKSNRHDIARNKAAGEFKKVAGKITGNQQLELKGRIQSRKADFRKKTSLAILIDNFKENIAGKINKILSR